MAELINLARLQGVLEEYGKQAEELYKYQIALGAHNASRNLVDNVKAIVEMNGSAWEVSLTLAHYWKYLEGGSQGVETSPAGAIYPAHFPPPYILEKWINIQPVLPRPMENGKLPSPKQLSYMIAHSIQKRGQEPFPALATTIEELNEQYKGKFAVALGEDVTDYIRKVVSLGSGTMSQKI